MPSVEFDLGYLDTAVELLEGFLLSSDNYWKLNVSSPPGEPGYPTLTLGTVILALARLEAGQLSDSQEQRKFELQNELNRLRTKWRTAWGKKAKKEFRSRLNLWRNFIEDLRQDSPGNFDRYPYEVNRRVMLKLLQDEAFEIPVSQQQMLTGLDRIINGLLIPGEFVWDNQLAGGFPQEMYPYLYRSLRK